MCICVYMHLHNICVDQQANIILGLIKAYPYSLLLGNLIQIPSPDFGIMEKSETITCSVSLCTIVSGYLTSLSRSSNCYQCKFYMFFSSDLNSRIFSITYFVIFQLWFCMLNVTTMLLYMILPGRLYYIITLWCHDN